MHYISTDSNDAELTPAPLMTPSEDAAVLIPVDILPAFKTPAVQVLTLYSGMPTEIMERDITSRLERWEVYRWSWDVWLALAHRCPDWFGLFRH